MALVALRAQEHEDCERWWMVPCAGGVELRDGDAIVRTVTPASPLGRALMGLQVDDEGVFATPAGERSFEVVEVC